MSGSARTAGSPAADPTEAARKRLAVVTRPPVVLVPGLGLDGAAWEPTRRALDRLLRADARRNAPGAVAPQSLPRSHVLLLPGYGERADRSADLRPATLAALLLERLPEGPGGPDAAGPVVLAGHSASCQVAAHAAAQAPHRVAGLFLVGPTTDPRARGWLRLAGRWLRTAAHERPGQVPTLARQYHRTTLRAMARGMDAARRDAIEPVLRQARCPVLVVRGRHDRICPHDWAERLGGVVTLPGGGHMVPMTHGDFVAAAVVQLLDAASRHRFLPE